MFFGVAATASFVGTASNFFLAAEKQARKLDPITKEVFDTIDTDKDGTLSLQEFRLFAIMKFELVKAEDLKRIDRLFDGLDEDKNGDVSFEEIKRQFKQ